MPHTPAPGHAPHNGCGSTHGHSHSHEHGHDSSHPHHQHDHARPRSIYIYSPSGAVQDRAAFRRGLRRLGQAGFDVTVDEAALARHTRFAGTHAQRLAAIERAADSGADLALISRGGYGLNHLLPDIDYPRLAAAIDRGTAFMGFSDFTALQLALWQRTGRITWAGASLGADWGAPEGVDEITQACFEDVALGVGEGTGWRIGKDCAAYQGLHIDAATLWGGNLCVLTSLVGTPWMPQIDGGILFLEDVAEPPYRIERMLMQLEQAGILQRQRAIVLGQFTDARVTAHDRGFNLASLTAALRQRLPIPVLTRLPFGHVRTKVCLPFGATVQLGVTEREAFIVWGHV